MDKKSQENDELLEWFADFVKDIMSEKTDKELDTFFDDYDEEAMEITPTIEKKLLKKYGEGKICCEDHKECNQVQYLRRRD